MTSREDWKNFDPIESIRGLKNFLKLVGVWPLDIRNRALYYLYIIYGILFQLTFSYAYATFGSIIDESDVKLITEQIFDALGEITMCVRITNFFYYFKDATGFLNRIKSFELQNQDECELYRKRLALFSKVMTVLLIVTTFALTFSNGAPLFSSETRLSYPGWYPLDWRNNRTHFWIVYTYQLIGGFFLAHTLVRLQNYQIFCMTCATAQIEILSSRIEKIGYENCMEDKTMTRRKDMECESFLYKCLKQHKMLMKFVSDMERVFAVPFLFQLICSIIIFCVTGYRIILMEDDILTLGFYITYFGVFLNEIFLMCYFGTLLTMKNENLSQALYSSNWPDLSQSFKRAMIIVLEYLKRPVIMKGGKIFTITLNSFLTVINRSYSMFAVLRTLMK